MQKILTSTAHGLVKSNTTSFLRVTSVRLTTLVSLLLATLLLAACGGGGGSSSSGGGASNPAGVITAPVGNIAGFPDDGAVSYTLNITRQNIASPTSSWNVTATTTGGTCSISAPSVTPLTYGTNNQTTTSFDITFIGTATVGGSCNVNFAVNEDEQIRNLRRTVTFNPEQAPTLVASLIGSGENIPASIPVRVELTATKRDAGKLLDITFLNNIVSSGSPSCTATLASAASQYSTAAGTSTAVATYNVRPTSGPGAVSNCGVFSFNATEGSASGSRDFSDSISFLADTDSDGDDIFDAMDVDADGDGLIEIRTAAELNMMRYNLGGTSLKASMGATGNSMGCGGGMTVSGTAITACNGYEQIANIDLNDLAAVYPGPATWERVGSCTGDDLGTACVANVFSGKFNGNNHNISNMHIRVTAHSFGVGFFGVVSSGSEIRNVHVRGGSITHQAGAALRYTGGLAGVVLNGVVNASSVYLSEINTSGFQSGGLIGIARGAKIISSAAVIGTIIAATDTGGLVGHSGANTLIISSAAVTGKIISDSTSSGGLVGILSGGAQEISASYAVIELIMNVNAGAGGLLGDGSGNIDYVISHSYAMSRNLTSSTSQVGGLAGNGDNAIINSSYAVSHSITGTGGLGGLAGASGNNNFAFPDAVIDSYWDTTTLMPTDTRGLPTDRYGEGQPTSALQTQTTFNGIYDNWGDGYCNPDTGEFRTGNPGAGSGFVQAWDLGVAGSNEYPKLNCRPNYDPAQLQQAIDRVLAGESPIQ